MRKEYTKITETKETWIKNPNTKTTYILQETETRIVDSQYVDNCTRDETRKFFRRLGGTERVERAYTHRGLQPIKLTSISPDRQTKYVRKWAWEYIAEGF